MNPELQVLLASIWAILAYPLGLVLTILIGYLLTKLVKLVDMKGQSEMLVMLYRQAYLLVSFAEQALPKSANDTKFAYVRDRMHFYAPSLSEAQISELIEAAVLALHNALEALPVPEAAVKQVVAVVPHVTPEEIAAAILSAPYPTSIPETATPESMSRGGAS